MPLEVQYGDEDPEPLATFRFMYRSRRKRLLLFYFQALLTPHFSGSLQILGVIPRSTTPVSIDDDPSEGLNTDELREIIRRQGERLKELERVPKEEDRNVQPRPAADGLGVRGKPVVIEDDDSDD